MSVRAMSWVFDYSRATGNDRVVLLAIADRANDDGTDSYRSVPTLARKARVPRRTAQRCIRRLEEAGEIVSLIANGPRGANLYILRMGRTDDELRPLIDRLISRWGPGRGGRNQERKGGRHFDAGGGTSDAPPAVPVTPPPAVPVTPDTSFIRPVRDPEKRAAKPRPLRGAPAAHVATPQGDQQTPPTPYARLMEAARKELAESGPWDYGIGPADSLAELLERLRSAADAMGIVDYDGGGERPTSAYFVSTRAAESSWFLHERLRHGVKKKA